MKCYTSFVVEGRDPIESLHVTHAYLGTVTMEQLAKVRDIIVAHFNAEPFAPFHAEFSEFAKFGPRRNVLVYKADLLLPFRPQLWSALHRVKPASYPLYQPHITVEQKDHGPLAARITNYVIIVDGAVVGSIV